MVSLARIVRWIGERAASLYTAVGAFLVVGLGAAVLTAVLFVFLARGVVGGVGRAADEAVVAWFLGLSNPFFDALALLGAALGSSVALWIVLGIGSAVFWRTRHHYSAAMLWVALVGGYALNRLLKAFFGRPRPRLQAGDLDLLGWTFAFPTSPSFPSGHAVTSVVVFGTLAYLVSRLEPTVRMRRWTLAGAAFLILLIGLSRVYLGVHYPSDVLAGYFAGFVWATACALSIEVVRRLRGRLRGDVEEADLDTGIRPLGEAADPGAT
jgi:membrane-associated phospholipid phosphatase